LRRPVHSFPLWRCVSGFAGRIVRGTLRNHACRAVPAPIATMNATPKSSPRAARAGRRQQLARLCQRTRLLPLAERLRAVWRDDLRILAYHRVLEQLEPPGFDFDPALVSASAERFEQQMKLVRRRYRPLRFDELLSLLESGRRVPPRSVMVTFDDGYDDNHRVAFPILRDLGLSAMFFVSTGHIDTGRPYGYDWLVHMLCRTDAARLAAPELGIDWQLPATLEARRALGAELLDRIKTLDDLAQNALIERLARDWNLPRTGGNPHCRPMTWEQLREMQRGGMEVGSHGVDHRMLAKLDDSVLDAELFGSRAALQRELGGEMAVLSYPVGGPDAYDERVIARAQAAGFRLACSYVSGTSMPSADNRFALRRMPIERDTDAPWFEAMLALPEVFAYPSRQRTG
jgi:peptidoglycan/xylan/chitin deacetylase (PgdA/CDA1 family)